MIDDVEAAIKQGSNEEEQAAIAEKRAEVSSDHWSVVSAKGLLKECQFCYAPF